MNKIIQIIVLFLSVSLASSSFASENIFYVLRSNAPSQITTNQNSFSSLKSHYKSVDILISQAYQVDQNGIVWGYLDKEIEKFTKEHKIKMMVLVTNVDFNTEKAHKFLANPKAQQRAMTMLMAACEKNHYYGVQFDYEMISLDDRNALTAFYKMATEMLHKKGFVVSYAVAPVVADNPAPSDFLKRLYIVWEGAYDLPALGKMGDFVTIMAYNQHAAGTTPGSTAAAPWVEESIKYALRDIPADKISLGIPTYSTYWYTGSDDNNHIRQRESDIGYDKVSYLLQKYHLTLHWDDQQKVNYVIYEHNWLNEYIFAEDADAFKAKMALVDKYHLRGISVFCLGIEDPKIWNQLT